MKFYPTIDETLTNRFEPHTEDGLSEIRDIVNHGIMGGFSGFIYTHEIVEFFNEFKYEIETRLDDMGLTVNDLTDDGDIDFDMLMTKAVWIVVESWCAYTLDCIDDTIDQEVDLSVVA